MKKQYKVIDVYECILTLGYADTMEEVKKIADQQYDDTDGECDCYYMELNRYTNTYSISSMRHVF